MLNFLWFPGGGGVNIFTSFYEGEGGSSKIWIMDRNFSRPPPDT